jgi:hypothetical protein
MSSSRIGLRESPPAFTSISIRVRGQHGRTTGRWSVGLAPKCRPWHRTPARSAADGILVGRCQQGAKRVLLVGPRLPLDALGLCRWPAPEPRTDGRSAKRRAAHGRVHEPGERPANENVRCRTGGMTCGRTGAFAERRAVPKSVRYRRLAGTPDNPTTRILGPFGMVGVLH